MKLGVCLWVPLSVWALARRYERCVIANSRDQPQRLTLPSW